MLLARHAANAVTALRIVLTPVFLWCVLAARDGGSGWPAAAVFAVVALSDFVDGRIARRLGAAGAAGQMLDHRALDNGEYAHAVSCAQSLPPLRFPLCTARLGGEQFANQRNEASRQQIRRAGRFGHGLFGLDKATSHMCPAAEMHEPVIVGDAVVKLVAVGHERSAGPHAGVKPRPSVRKYPC